LKKNSALNSERIVTQLNLFICSADFLLAKIYSPWQNTSIRYLMVCGRLMEHGVQVIQNGDEK